MGRVGSRREWKPGGQAGTVAGIQVRNEVVVYSGQLPLGCLSLWENGNMAVSSGCSRYFSCFNPCCFSVRSFVHSFIHLVHSESIRPICCVVGTVLSAGETDVSDIERVLVPRECART